MVLILWLTWKVVCDCVFQLRTNKKVNFNVLLWHTENHSQDLFNSVWVWVGCNSNNVTSEIERQSERLAEKWGEREEKQLSYILSHHLPRAKLAACAVNMSSGQAAAKMLETTSRLWLTLHTNIPAHMQESHACRYSTCMLVHTHMHRFYITNISESCMLYSIFRGFTWLHIEWFTV